MTTKLWQRPFSSPKKKKNSHHGRYTKVKQSITTCTTPAILPTNDSTREENARSVVTMPCSYWVRNPEKNTNPESLKAMTTG
jgi:hypothetical protein